MIGLIAVLVVFRLHGAAILDRVMARWRDAGGLRSRVASAITGISEGLQAIRTTSDLWMAVFYSAAHWLLATLIYLGVAKAFGDAFLHSDMNIAGAMLLIGITLVGSVLQLPGVGGGTQIAAFIGLTKIFGVEQEPAMAIAVSLWIVTFAGCTLAGIPLLIHEGLSFGELRQLARAEADAEESGKHIPVPGANGTLPPSTAVKDAVKEKLRGDSAR
jgi:predicted aconitase with swiveling domain